MWREERERHSMRSKESSLPRKEGSPRVAVLRTGRLEDGPSGSDGARDEGDEMEQRKGWEEKVPRKPVVEIDLDEGSRGKK